MELEVVLKWMELFNEKVQAEKVKLTELDTPIGDADHGNNMSRGMKAVMEGLETDQPETAADALKVVAKNLLSKVGGSAGPLYGSAILALAKGVQNEAELAESMNDGLEAIKKRGKSTEGEKTMIDTWSPVVKALKEGALTSEVIQDAVENTKDMKATKGRASYVGERSIGHIDPGAYSSGLLFEAFIEAGGIE
ncbi:MAG TPA: dihydroxyacetone kinase subunit L [Facklamia tabacinasalis]|nr:dihydroxyacetone kinase subunit L [Ruoffia tabacinasalis]